ncbi:MAG: hypothetical protein ACLFRU_08180 [Paracoccaceae bacterium]
MQTEYLCRHARLVFDTPRQFDLATLSRQVATLLELQGQRVESCRITTDGKAGLETTDMVLGLAPDTENALAVTLEGRGDIDIMHLHVCHKLVSRLAPAQVEWQTPGVLVPAADFLKAVMGEIRPVRPESCANRAPHRPRTVPALPPSQILDEAVMTGLRAAFRDAPDATPAAAAAADEAEIPPQPLRLAAWAMSLTVAIFSLPVAAALIVLNLGRGEDLRLSAHALALTGLFMTLDHAGALTQVAELFPA